MRHISTLDLLNLQNDSPELLVHWSLRGPEVWRREDEGSLFALGDPYRAPGCSATAVQKLTRHGEPIEDNEASRVDTCTLVFPRDSKLLDCSSTTDSYPKQ